MSKMIKKEKDKSKVIQCGLNEKQITQINNAIAKINAKSAKRAFTLPKPENTLPNFPFNGDMDKWKGSHKSLLFSEEKYLSERVEEGYVVSHFSFIGKLYNYDYICSPIPPKIIGKPKNIYEYKEYLYRKFIYENELSECKKKPYYDNFLIETKEINVDNMSLSELVRFREKIDVYSNFECYYDNKQVEFYINLKSRLICFKMGSLNKKEFWVDLEDMVGNCDFLKFMVDRGKNKYGAIKNDIIIGTFSTSLSKKQFKKYLQDSINLLKVNWKFYNFTSEKDDKQEDRFKRIYDIIGGNE